ncbi:MAG: Ig-like domain-containing protein [Candidatus Choladocola sp.]|nr:Ig-like domain-containing protein [Candidatus Choladocola sp.]
MRKKLALMMAAAMILTSIPPSGLVGYAEELIVEEDPDAELVAEDVTAETEPVSEQETEKQGTDENGTADQDLAEPGDTELIESITVVEAVDDMQELGEEGEEGISIDNENTESSPIIEPNTSATLMPVINRQVPDGYTYAWYSMDHEGNITPIENASDSTYTTETLSRNARYRFQIIDENGSAVVTFDFTVQVNTLTVGTDQTFDQISSGQSLTLTATADSVLGSENLTYQWYLVDLDNLLIQKLDGATAAQYSIESVTGSAYYRCEISDGNETETQDFNVIVYSDTLTIEGEQQLIEAEYEETVTLTASAVSVKEDAELTYKWYDWVLNENNEPVEHILMDTSTNNQYTVTAEKSKFYYCEISDQITTKTQVFELRVNTLDEGETQTGFEVDHGSSVSLTTSITSKLPDAQMSYEWYEYDLNTDEVTQINDAVSPTYTIDSVTEKRSYFCRVKDQNSQMDQWFTVSVKSTIVIEDGDWHWYDVVLNGTKTIQVNVKSAAGDLKYQWYKATDSSEGETKIEGATGASLTSDPITERTYYCCEITDGVSTERVTFEISVTTGLRIKVDPEEATVDPGGSVTLQATVTTKSDKTVTYQWYKNWEPLDGADGDKLELTDIQHSAYYQCEVYDGYEQQTSDTIDVVVDSGFSCAKTSASDFLVAPGDNVLLTANASTKSGTLSYEWGYEEESEFISLNNHSNVLYLTNIQTSREYQCKVSDGYNEETLWFYVCLKESTDSVQVEYESVVHVKPDEDAELSVTVPEGVAATYQWYYMDEDGEEQTIENETGAVLSLTSDQVKQQKAYRCIVVTEYGENICNIDVVIDSGLRISLSGYAERESNNVWISIPDKGTADLTVNAFSDSGIVTYQWYCGEEDEETWETIWTPIENETTDTVKVSDKGNYRCIVSDGYNTDKINFCVQESEFSLTGDSVVTADQNGNATLKVSANVPEGDTVTYQWYLWTDNNREEILNANTDSLDVTGIDKTRLYYVNAKLNYTVDENGDEDYEAGASRKILVIPADASVPDSYDKAALIETGFNPVRVSLESGKRNYFKLQAKERGTYNISIDVYHCGNNLLYERYNEEGLVVESSISGDFIGGEYDIAAGDSIVFSLENSDRWYGEEQVVEIHVNYQGNIHHWDEGTLTGGTSCGGAAQRIFHCTDKGCTETVTIDVAGDGEGHIFGVYVYNNDATCTEDGTETATCLCGQKTDTRTRIGSALGHSFTNYVSNGDATCTADGTKTATCDNCEATDTVTEEGSKVPHSFTHYESDGNATCTADGTKTATCDNCDETDTIPDEGSKLSHTFGDAWIVQVEATCTTDGIRYKKCTGEGCLATQSEVIPATGHTFEGQEPITEAATQEEDGKVYRKCADCDAITVDQILVRKQEMEKITALDVIINDEESQPSTTEIVAQIKEIDNQALIDSRQDELLQKIETRIVQESASETAPAVGATRVDSSNGAVSENVSAAGAAVSVAAAIENAKTAENNPFENGELYHAQISVTPQESTEEATYKVDISLDVVNSQNEPVLENAPLAAPITITIPVPAEYQGKEFKLIHVTSQGEVELPYSDNENGTITFSTPSLSPFKLQLNPCEGGHADGLTWITKVQATCTAPGTEETVCPRCGQPLTRAVEALGHEFDTKFTTDQEAGCLTSGSESRHCIHTGCEEKTDTKDIPAVGKHSWDNGVITTQPTCTEKGVKTFTCSRCKETKTGDVSAAGHKFASTFTADVHPTCIKEGSKSRHCTVCGQKTEVTVVKATGHKMTTVVDKAATCGAAGSRHRECTVCHTKEAATVIPATGKHTYGNYVVTQKPTAVAAGVETRTCTVCGHKDSRAVAKLSGTIKLTVKSIPLQLKKSVSLKQVVTGLAEGDSIASWKSDNTKIAAVDKNGKVTGKQAGKATITVTLASGISAKITVTVQKAAVKTTAITNVSKKVTLKKGEKATLKPVVAPITSLEKVTYSTSNKKVATVSSKGVIEAKASGTAKITVKSGSKKVTVTVIVQKVAPAKISGVPASKTLKKGKTLTLKPKLLPTGSEAKITYKSSNTKVATVNASGKITAKKAGKAVITVKAGNVSVKCTITVK